MAKVTAGASSKQEELPAAVAGGRVGSLRFWRTPTARRYLFGYTLLAPAVLYVLLLVGLPFLFSLYLAMSDATVGDPVARFVGLDNFKAALESPTFYVE